MTFLTSFRLDEQPSDLLSGPPPHFGQAQERGLLVFGRQSIEEAQQLEWEKFLDGGSVDSCKIGDYLATNISVICPKSPRL